VRPEITSEIGSKTEKATLAVCGLWLCRFVFVLESIQPCNARITRVYGTVLKTVEQNLDLG